ncbi:MAG TPA: class I SAM-dependent methyltransferase [Gelidibacter sp.]|uniref:class I SAM-dependent methyltransferase n=1 Tax=Gelidibacter sp. TaxID=2018083 RepID=UPI002BAC3C03|nr:class I SAM-dependent methyltransferase [Gelidibacter sp.]HXJ97602.1 class I SAM-dependent methyltransferase [Gelidibacter sp.]
MDETLRIYWELYNDLLPNELMIHKSHNLLRNFEEEFIEGPILELGCGQSNFLVEFSKTGKEIFAVDNEEFQLNLLKKRIESYAGKDVGKLHLLNITVPEKEIPLKIFSLVIASDFLHFFSINECKNIISQIIPRTQKGSLIYVKVHSRSHSYSESSDSGMHEYYKHFFTESDLTKLFDEQYFERMIFSNSVQNIKSKFTREMEMKWIEKVLDEYQIFDQQERQELFEENNKELNVGYLECVYRRK